MHAVRWAVVNSIGASMLRREKCMRPGAWLALAALVAATMGAASVVAEERLFLRDGFFIDGKPEIDENRVVVKSGPRLVYFGTRALLKSEGSPAEPPERIALPQLPQRTAGTLPGLARPPRAKPFDAFGRRALTFSDPRKKDRETTIVQAIVELFPTHVTLRSLSQNWRSTLDLTQLPSTELVPIVKKHAGTNQQNWVRGMNLLLQANRFDEVRALLAEFRATFPDGSRTAEELATKLDRRVVERALVAFHRAMGAGQLQRATQIEASLNRYVVSDALREKAAALGVELKNVRRNLADARNALAGLSLAVDSAERAAVEAALVEIDTGISVGSLARLEPLISLYKQPNVQLKDRLALALSGWALGPNLAQKDLEFALRIWKQRALIRRALAAENAVAADGRIDELRKLDARADLLMAMVPNLAPLARDLAPGGPHAAELDVAGIDKVKYHFVLPPEYDHGREYPTIVALHSADATTEQAAQFWKTLAAEHGYIVLAPEYRPDRGKPYQYSTAEHAAVLGVLSEARKRFAVDSDRVFLTGHDMGGMAAWDIGMSHPDQFAGLIPFTGTPAFYCDRYWPNVEHLPIYAVEGQYDGDNAPVTQQAFARFFTNGFDAIYVEYPGCGRESFRGELPSIFAWMEPKRRKAAPSQFKCTSARSSDRRFYWLEADAFMPNATVAPELFNKTKFNAAKMEGKAGDNNAIAVQATMLKGLSIYLPAKLVQLDAPDLTIRVQNKIVHRGPIAPDWELMLREVRRTGDRKNLVVQRIRTPL